MRSYLTNYSKPMLDSIIIFFIPMILSYTVNLITKIITKNFWYQTTSTLTQFSICLAIWFVLTDIASGVLKNHRIESKGILFLVISCLTFLELIVLLILAKHHIISMLKPENLCCLLIFNISWLISHLLTLKKRKTF